MNLKHKIKKENYAKAYHNQIGQNDDWENLKVSRGKGHNVQRNKDKNTVDVLSKTMQARKQWSSIFKIMKGGKKIVSNYNSIPSKIYFKHEG